MKRIKRIGTAFLCGSMMLSFAFGSTGCSLTSKSKEEILGVSESFCKALCDQKTKSAVKVVTEEDAEDDFDYYFDFADNDNAVAYEAIAKSLTYELDEESIEVDKKHGEASCDVVFTIADYETIIEEYECTNAGALADAIDESDATKDIDLTLDFEYVESGKSKTWAVANYEDILDEIFSFTEYEPEYVIDVPSSVTDYFILTSDWDDINVTYIDFDATFSMDYEDLGLSGYCDLYYNGTLIATEYCDVYDFIIVTFDAADCSIATEDGCFPAGNYEVQAFLNDGTFIVSDTVTVYYEAPTPTPTPTPEPISPDEYDHDSVGFASHVFEENGASMGEYYDEVGITSTSWLILEDTDEGGLADNETHVASDLSEFGYRVDCSEESEFTIEIYYFDDPTTSMGSLSDSEELTVTQETFELDDGTFTTCGLISDIQPGVYLVYVSCYDIDTEETIDYLVACDMIEIY